MLSIDSSHFYFFNLTSINHNNHKNQEQRAYSVTPKISLTTKELSLEQNSGSWNQNNNQVIQ